MPAICSDPVGDVVAAVGKLRADDRLITSPDMLLGDIEALLDAVTTLQAVVVRRLRAADAVDATTEIHGRSTKSWLVEEERLARPEAATLVRLSRRLQPYPLTSAAYDDAEIRTAHAAAILTALQSLPPGIAEIVEPHLIERARHYPPEEIGGFVDELLQLLGLDKPGDPRRERKYTTRGVDVARTMAGTRSLSGTLTPEVDASLEAALAAAAQKAGPGDDRTLRQRQHDALGVIADAYLAGNEPSFTGAPRTVIVTIDLETLEGRLRSALVTLPLGGTVSAETARRLACDAEIIPVVLGGKSEVIDVGQAGHEFGAPVRRAAYVRDGGRCAFPGCTNACVELHHIVFRRHGGPPTLANAAWLCAYHHWLAHEGRWTLERDPATGDYLWTGPAGQHRVRHLGTA